MKEYDSILKEKKVYKDPEPIKHSKYTKYIIIYFVSLILILGISYFVYYQKILTGNNIFLEDANVLFTKYQSLFSPLQNILANDNYALEGNLELNNQNYQINLVRNQSKLRIDLSNQSQNHLSYYVENRKKYLQLSSFKEEYISLDSSSYFNILDTIKTNFQKYIQEEDYIKKFYLEEKLPIVEIDLVLTKDMISKILGFTFDDDYEVMITLKNNAILNQLVSMKVVLNNQTTRSREVLNYHGNELDWVDVQGNTTKFILENNQQDFTLKIYQKEILYSVLTGTKAENTYQYVYQVIDEVYNINIKVSNDNGTLQYDFSSSKEEDGVTKSQTANLALKIQNNTSLEEIHNIKKYNELTEEEKNSYNNSLEQIIDPLRQFVKEYQKSID